jgi:hypothetical protein
MATVPAFKINGIVDTKKTCLTNLNILAKASGCWMSYDSMTGLWSVIINKEGNSVKSFTDNTIIGNINITGTGIDQLYNSADVQYSSQDLYNKTDSIDMVLDSSARFPNELDKALTIQLDCVSNPIQAAFIGIIELKQNRVDKIIQFRTDYTSLGLKAGNLIDITSTMYGYTSKVFRIVKITEEDGDDGSIQISITALEYDADVYNSSGLVYAARTTATGVVPKNMNTALTAKDLTSGYNTPLVYTAVTGQVVLPYILHTSTDYYFDNTAVDPISTGKTFTLPFTGTYRVSYGWNFGSYGDYDGAGKAALPNTIRKNAEIHISTNSGTPVIINGTSILFGEDPRADLASSGTFTGTKGQVITFYQNVYTDMDPTTPGCNANSYIFAITTIELFYLGA